MAPQQNRSRHQAMALSARAMLTDEVTRHDLLNRLRRAEGQVRGIQRMVEEGRSCREIASQLAAVRKALDSSYVRMAAGFMEQELGGQIADNATSRQQLNAILGEMQNLLGRAP
jgi:CsoR family transcriptional regulator, copper-sensing transcriptional repressor